MNRLTLPTRDLHARRLAEGLTAFSYEQIENALAEVTGAATAYENALSAAEALWASTAMYGTSMIAWEGFLSSGAATTLRQTLQEIENAEPVVSRRTTRDEYPICNWAAGSAAYRRLTARILTAGDSYLSIRI